jgi:glycerophosphoryl diester phosphodiesterase
VSVWTSAGPLVVGHRGGRGEGWPPENTIAAFEQAREQGARAIELDVRTGPRGQLVVLHDATREAMGDLRRRGVPTLGEALAWAHDRGVAVNVEMKHEDGTSPAPRGRGRHLGMEGVTLARATVRVVRGSGADVLLSSFDPLLLVAAAAAWPALPRALLVHSRQAAWADVAQAVARPPLVGAIHLERTQTDPRVIARHRRRGLRVGVWTVNDAHEARDLVRLGVSTIITDEPGRILGALRLPVPLGPPARLRRDLTRT